MESGARGCQVIISGKLTGERHRTEKFREGHIKYCGEPKQLFMKIGFAVAKKKPGIIGIKVQIMWPDARLPDEIRIREPAAAPAEAAPQSAAAAAPAQPATPEAPAPETKPESQAPEKKPEPAPQSQRPEAPATTAKKGPEGPGA